MNISFKKNINKFKKGANFLLTISGGVFLLYFFYKDILLKKSRIFKSCPHNAFQVNLWEKSFSNAYLFKPLNYLCPKDKEICKNQLNGEIYMFDRDHLNFYGGKILSLPLLNYMQTKYLLAN